MVEASSAYDTAEKMQVRPACTKEMTSAGPDSPMITKTAVPMIAPMPRAARSSAPIPYGGSFPRPSSRSCSVDLVASGSCEQP